MLNLSMNKKIKQIYNDKMTLKTPKNNIFTLI